MITILKPGLLTTIQDLGRFGYQKFGVITSGAMDQLACRMANILVGNHVDEPTVEMTILGPVLRFENDALIAICSADFTPKINGETVRSFRPVFVRKESVLTFGSSQNGSRAYLAIAGGIDVPVVMKSKSTYLRAQIGGFHGRKLKKGDRLPVLAPGNPSKKIMKKLSGKSFSTKFSEANWFVNNSFFSTYKDHISVRVMMGREFHLFSKESQKHFFREKYAITSRSDRMGYRLEGCPLFLEKQIEMVSDAVSFGTIQVPADGKPIVLLADRQTTGGYPKIAQIASVDLQAVAQAKPGDSISFRKISHEEAQLLYLQQENDVKLLKKAIELKYS